MTDRALTKKFIELAKANGDYVKNRHACLWAIVNRYHFAIQLLQPGRADPFWRFMIWESSISPRAPSMLNMTATGNTPEEAVMSAYLVMHGKQEIQNSTITQQFCMELLKFAY